MRPFTALLFVFAALFLGARACAQEEVPDVVQTEADDEIKERRKAFEECLGREVAMAWSEHVLVLTDHKGFKLERRKLRGEKLAAAVVRMVHAQFLDYCEVFGADPKKDFKHRVEVLLLEEPEDHAKIARVVLEWTAPEDSEGLPVRRSGDRGTYSVVLGAEFAKDGKKLRARLVHNLARLFLSGQRPASVLSTSGNGWVSLGVGMWFEDRALGTVSACDRPDLIEGLPSRPRKWRAQVKKLVTKNKIKEFEDLLATSANDLDPTGALVAASLVDFLYAKDPVLLREFITHMKGRTPARDSLQIVYGWKLDEFEEAWHVWVKKNYK